MANLNLSEFTEKLFVADADHTFIWDSAASISKRVSRNSWLNSGTLTSDAPVTISQTWNQIGTAFTAFKVNAVSTASATGSLLADFQVGGVSQFSVSKVGAMVSAFSITSSYIQSNANFVLTTDAGAVVWGATPDTWLRRDGAGQLALRNGAAAQTFNVYGTYTSGTSYERLTLSAPSAANAIIGTNKGSGGGTARGLDLHTDGAARMTITTSGNVGIGTTAPGAKLEIVESTSNVAGLVLRTTTVGSPRFEFIDGAATPNKWSFGCGVASAIDGKFFIYDARQLVHRFAIDTAGNVGIGTTAPSTKLEVALPASGNTFNQGIKLSRGTGYITLGNGTISNDNFVGQFSGKGSNTASAVALGFLGVVANDSDTTSPVVYFTTRNNAETGPIGNSQIAYQFRNYTDNLVTVLGSGNLGIGTTSPTSKLQVSAGDVEVDTIAKGVILKSPDGTRYRVTVANGGTLSVAAV